MNHFRKGCELAVYNGTLYAAGGYAHRDTKATVERYEPRTETWEEVQAMEHQRHIFALVGVNRGNAQGMRGPLSVAAERCNTFVPCAGLYAIGGCSRGGDPLTPKWNKRRGGEVQCSAFSQERKQQRNTRYVLPFCFSSIADNGHCGAFRGWQRMGSNDLSADDASPCARGCCTSVITDARSCCALRSE